MLTLLTLFALFVYWVSLRPDFTDDQLRDIKAVWLEEKVVRKISASQQVNQDELVESTVRRSTYLSPDYLKVVSRPNDDIGRMRQRLVLANAELDGETRARMLAAAFLKAPGETVVAGIALVDAARACATHLALTDHLRAAEIAEFAVVYELQVAGCVRALDSEGAVNAFMTSRNGAKALAKSVAFQCYDVVCVPQIQMFLECQFHGFDSLAQLEESSSFHARLYSSAWFAVKVVLMPLVAFYPPLAEQRTWLYFPPILRYYLYECMAVVYFFLVAFSDLSIHRAEPLGIRDWGLLAWSFMSIFSQCQFVYLGGVANFAADATNVVDLIANVSSFTGFLLAVCHGHDGFLASTFPSQCGSWPITVPIAAWEVMSIAMLLHGFRASRILTLHPTYGPLMLSISYMAVDMARWVVVVAFPIFGFAGAFKMLYGEQYKDPSIEQGAACIDPDVDFESTWFAIQLLIEGMLSGDGYFECLRHSMHSVMGPLYGYLFLLVTTIMLVNMLVALMAKTFDDVTENVTKAFLYGKTRKVCNWVNYPPIPPPFNLCSLPCYAAQLLLRASLLVGKSLKRRAARKQQQVGAIDSVLSVLERATSGLSLGDGNKPQEAKLPPSWHDSLGKDPLANLTSQIMDFKRDNADQDTQNDDFRSEVVSLLAELKMELRDLSARVDAHGERAPALASPSGSEWRGRAFDGLATAREADNFQAGARQPDNQRPDEQLQANNRPNVGWLDEGSTPPLQVTLPAAPPPPPPPPHWPSMTDAASWASL